MTYRGFSLIHVCGRSTRKHAKRATTEVYRTRIMLVGHFAAGKTSVKRSLLNEEFVPKHQATEGVETEDTVNVFMTHVKEEGKGSFRWEKVRCDFLPYVHHHHHHHLRVVLTLLSFMEEPLPG